MIRTTLYSLLVFIAAMPAVAQDVPAGQRAALVLGNAKYDGFALPGMTASLDQVDKAFRNHGYHVTRHENLNKKDLDSAVEEFVRSVPTAGVAVVYYYGLAANIERSGKRDNYLRPVGEQINSDNDYRSRSLSVNEVVKSLHEQSAAKRVLLFLDASWKSPLKPDKETVDNGLREVALSDGVCAMLSAPSGQTLPPRDEPSKLAKAIDRHLVDFDMSLMKACQAMAAETGGAWFGGAEGALGKPSQLPMTNDLRAGMSAGEGYVNSIGMTFRWCPAGSFTMGSPRVDHPATRDRRAVQVSLSRGFWMGEHEVTQRENYVVARRNVPRGFTEHKNAPFWGASEAKQVSDFCKKLTELERKAGTLPDGWEYACPSEAQWEYACRAGSPSDFCFGDDVAQLGRYGNIADNALHTANGNYHYAETRTDDGVAEALAPVGSYLPNAWGLRDMHGNVAELVADHLLPELPGGTDPLARVEKNGVTQIRGGAWCSLPLYCESSFRNSAPGRDKHNFIGFRIVLQKVK